jgi:hypothetical protein
MIDTGLLAEFMAAHPEDELAKKAAGAANAAASPFAEDEEPAEGKTSIASLDDIQAAAEEANTQRTAPPEPVKARPKDQHEHRRRQGAPEKAGLKPKHHALKNKPLQEEQPGTLDFNTLNSPVEKAVKPFLEDLPRKEVKQAPIDQKIPTASVKAPITSAPVEEMEDMWDNIDDQDMVEWSSRSAEHQAPVIEPQAEAAQIAAGAMAAAAPAASDNVPRLICLAGELHGQIFPLSDKEVVVGRHDD